MDNKSREKLKNFREAQKCVVGLLSGLTKKPANYGLAGRLINEFDGLFVIEILSCKNPGKSFAYYYKTLKLEWSKRSNSAGFDLSDFENFKI